MSKDHQADTFVALEKREWAKTEVVQSYAKVFAKAADLVVRSLVAAVRAGPDVKVLDLCCGHGNVAAGLCKAGAQVTGLDFSPAMLEMARKVVPEVRFVEGDAMSLNFEDQSFIHMAYGGRRFHRYSKLEHRNGALEDYCAMIGLSVLFLYRCLQEISLTGRQSLR